MSEIEYLGLEDLLVLVRVLSVGPVRDVGLLDSAAAQPRSTAFGDAYPTPERKAAALLHSLPRSHCLVDGSKRLAWLATVVFLGLNRHAADVRDDEAFHVVMDVAAGSADVDEITWRLQVRPEPPNV